MGFGGAAAAMATILKNNNRRGTREGFDGFSNSHKEKGKLERKKISKEALAKIRNKMKAEQRSLFIKRSIVFCFVVAFLITSVYFILKN